MLELILSHWGTPLFLGWLALLVVVNACQRKKTTSGEGTGNKAPKGLGREHATEQLQVAEQPIRQSR